MTQTPLETEELVTKEQIENWSAVCAPQNHGLRVNVRAILPLSSPSSP